MSTMPVDDESTEITYEEFGRRFFEVAVTEQRVGSAIADIAGDEFEMGPIAQGPGKIAKVTAKVRIQEPRLTRHVGPLITFAIRIPLEIDMMVDLRIDKPKFMVFGEIALNATARAAEPLLLILDVEKPRASDISIHVTSKSLRGEVVRILGGIDAEIRRFIAAHVAGEIDSPASQKAKVIDVGATIDTAWTGV
ncbi:hypothetical protein [Mycolicibacterium novocastrense]|uniref:Uncharacterized protein n=1 Tax=Mycolicibacterium novocastrense TaxID=59813 RepID=A0AAW5SEL6_MYCNV|nr:hypothetical protein [Mycolicibacterium novocastrense]MCV7022055.1 hypothetical protein [Mycolicibacterium novocastrense]GAT11823.1 hypothetical protein RMCN_4956 [Mycolicibacterium novocastrense]